MKRSSIGSSWHIATIAKIPIKIHWSFGLLLLFVFYMAKQNELINEDIVWFFVLVMIMFVFVVMHEFGHALTARRFGVKTRDIIISPIGGVARLESIPKVPRQELLIALAGPAVNVGLTIFFGLGLLIFGGDLFSDSQRINPVIAPSAFISYLLSINIALVLFNMVPAFPMDGGRVLRALLSMFFNDHLTATKWASRTGQALSVLFVAGGLYFSHFGLVFIGLFVFITARREYFDVRLQDKMTTTKVADIMLTESKSIYAQDEINIQSILANDKGSLVLRSQDDKVIGVIPELFIVEAKKNPSADFNIGNMVSQAYGYINGEMSVKSAFNIMNEYGWAVAIVVDQDQKESGIIDRRLLRSFIS